jgi:Dehydrogenases with different specificities (related to short-chain alcohol dehydrogenases)
MNKSVFVTGACSGTGYAIAERFAKEGYDIFITSREPNNAQIAAEKLAKQYGVFTKGYELASGNEEKVIEVFEDIKKTGHLLDTCVFNAANLGIGMDFFKVPLKEFMEVFETNLGWNFTMARQAALQMKEKHSGAIVFITSNTAYRAIPNRSAYCASKGGMISLSKALAIDLGQYGIRVNCVVPGMIKTIRWQNSEAIRSTLSNYTPIGDIAEFEDIANGAWYLGSDQSRNTTGAEIIIDGGNCAQLYPQVPEQK